MVIKSLSVFLFLVFTVACASSPSPPPTSTPAPAPATTETTAPSTVASTEPPRGGCHATTECKAGQFCKVADGCGGAPGACEDKPFACPRIAKPVCGCDGKTYGNACEANAAGVSIRAFGACAAQPG